MAEWPPPGDYEIIFDPSFQEAQDRAMGEQRIQKPPFTESRLELQDMSAGSSSTRNVGAAGGQQATNEAPPTTRNCRLIFNKVTRTVRLEVVPEPTENIITPITQNPARGSCIDLEIAGSSSQAGIATVIQSDEDTVEVSEDTVHPGESTVGGGEGTVARSDTWELSASELAARLENMEYDRERAQKETARRFGELGLEISDSESDGY